jgi:uncharacterized protein with GYD domain
MPYYLYQLSYSSDAIKAMVANPTDREAAARGLVEALGGKLHHLFFAFGEYDVVCLIEGPDDVFMMAAVGSAGTVSASATTKLMTSAEAMSALEKAGEVTSAYSAPHG